MRHSRSERQDVDAGVTTRIIAGCEQGVRPWLTPWAAARTVGRITRPRRHNGIPDRGTNSLLQRGEAMPCGDTSPCPITCRHAHTRRAHVRAIALVTCHAMSQQKGRA